LHANSRVTVSSQEAAIAASQDYLLSIQNPAGYWWQSWNQCHHDGRVVLLHKIWGTDRTRPLHKAEVYLRSQQRDGGWELFWRWRELSTSVEAYMALKLLGVTETDPAMMRGRAFI